MIASRVSTSARSTPHQRLCVRTMMQRLELDTARVTLYHNRLWVAAAIPAPALGTDLDAYLCGLTQPQTRALIDALKKEIPDE